MAASDDLQVLLVCPLGKDAEVIRSVLSREGIEGAVCSDIASAIQVIHSKNGGALLVAEEALNGQAVTVLASALDEQPSWSDVPVLVLTARGKHAFNGSSPERYYLPLGKVTLIERPMHVATLVSSVKAALRARTRQYERRLAEEALRNSEKFAAVGRVASSIAHDINNPLEAITNLLFLLSGTTLSAEQRQYLEMAQEQLARVSEIAAHTLTFNRQRNIRGEASISEILKSVLTLYNGRLANSQVAIESRFQNTAPITCYPGELRQLFSNLIGNALDATRNGGRVILRERAVVNPRTHDRGIQITVADNGHGMGSDVKAHLFDPFYSTKGSNGTGLGLWISKGIVEKHGGSIRLRSSTKQGCSGTVFSIFIPSKADAGRSSSGAVLERHTA